MAHHQEILVKDLKTRSVTLYPARAHIIRDIENVVLKEGANEIEIYGITPTADEHSVKVDGTGPATIIDMTVDLVPNHDFFDELESESSDSEEEDMFLDDLDTIEVKNLKQEIKNIEANLDLCKDKIEAASKRLSVLDKYADSLNAEHNSAEALEESLDTYQKERERIFKSTAEFKEECRKRVDAVQRKRAELKQASKESRRRKSHELKEKAKERAKKQRQKAEKREEAQRIMEERLKYWPKQVYRVVIHLETATDTPTQSRRSSFGSVQLATSPSPTQSSGSTKQGPPKSVSLALSYVTYEASWSPRYDINILTPTKSGSIVYRAEFSNKTSETWKDAKISLSTSQTSYQGLEDTVPIMDPWHIRLQRGVENPSLYSRNEEIAKLRLHGQASKESKNKREALFGNTVPKGVVQVQQMVLQQAMQANVQASMGHFGHGGGYWPTQQPQAPQIPQSQDLQHIQDRVLRSRAPNLEMAAPTGTPRPFGDNGALDLYGDETLAGPQAIEFEESTWEDYGLTATYDVPGTRTLAPSSLTRRHKIATLSISNLILTSICVPKLRSAAFMRARFRNPSSSITLLKGMAGLTLDGSFLGNTSIPRVSPGELVTLPLGVDPALHVSYAKPTVHRSMQGLFSKEKAEIFSRNVWLTNTKTTPVELLVLDQVPVSDDERLRMDLRLPRGLVKEGGSVKAGANARQDGDNGKWGSAQATLKKNGEVAWNVKLEKGQACVLGLEYEAKAPANEGIITA